METVSSFINDCFFFFISGYSLTASSSADEVSPFICILFNHPLLALNCFYFALEEVGIADSISILCKILELFHI